MQQRSESGATAMEPQQSSERVSPTTSSKDVVFEAGTYDLKFESGSATVHVEHDVTAVHLERAVREFSQVAKSAGCAWQKFGAAAWKAKEACANV